MKQQSNFTLGCKDFLQSIKTWQIISTLAKNDIKQRYKRSTLGQFWITISMGVMIASMGVVFSTLFNAELSEFLPYLCIGIISWTFISTTISDGCNSFISAEGIIKQLPIPYSTHVLRVILRNILIFFHNIIIFPFVILFVQKELNVIAFLSVLGLLIVALNLCWLGMILALLCARYRDLPQIITSILQLLFYLTPVIWSISQIKHDISIGLIQLNPFYSYIDLIRTPLLGEYPSLQSWLVSISLLFLGFYLAMFFLGKYSRKLTYWL